MEYYSDIKKSEIFPFAAAWVKLEGIMISDISQSETDRYNTYCMVSFICGIFKKQVKLIETESRKVVARAGRWGK